MYAIIALILVVAFVLTTMGLPLRMERVYERIRPRMGRAAQWVSGQAVLPSMDESARETMSLTRVWLLLSALGFTILGIADGGLIQNRPEALRSIAAYGILACGFSAVIVSLVLAYKRLVSRVGLESTFRRCGFRGLWILGSRREPKRLAEHIRTQAKDCSEIQILDVIGHDIFVKRGNIIDRTLRDVLETRTDVPVQLLLLDPMTQQRDPDRRRATVFQTTCAELHTQSCPFIRHLRETMASVHALNQERPPESRITLRFYGEKPTFRAVMFDDSMLILPCGPVTKSKELSCLGVERDSEAPSFYETFRREFARLWQGSVATIFTG
jgi:hypothetical protein